MKKTIVFAIIYMISMVSINLRAQLLFDTINYAVVGPGITLTEVIEVTKPWSIQIMEVDLTNPFLSIATAKANDRLAGLEKTSSMSMRKSVEGNRVVGAINGDFFSGTGIPVNAQIAEGEIVRTPISRGTIGFDVNKMPIIQIPGYSGKVISKTSNFAVNNVNADRFTDAMILYNSFMGSSTNTNEFGNEVVCTPISEWYVNDTVWCTVGNVQLNTGNINIPEGKVVLSGHGLAASFLADNLNSGDTIGFLLNIGDNTKVLTSLIGGYPQIIASGISSISGDVPSHTAERHPRTAVGYSEDYTKLYLVTVDGRQESSIGITLAELADYMLTFNIYEAINLDGGGSTTMVANNEVVNSPSDVTGERNVANALLVKSSAPLGSLEKISIRPSKLNIRYGSTKHMQISGYDEYDNVIEIEPSTLSWEIINNVGVFIENDTFKANGTDFTGYIKATFEAFTDSIPVTVYPIEEFALIPDQITTDSIIPVNFQALGKNLNSTEYAIDKELITWSVADEGIGLISSDGIFNGLKNGTTQVIANIGEAEARANVNVEIYSETEILDDMESPESWNVTSTFFDNVQLSISEDIITEGAGSMQIDYQFTYAGRQPYFSLYKSIPVKGIPDSIWVDGKFNGELFRVSHNLSTTTHINNFMYSGFVDNVGFYPVGAILNVQELNEYPYQYKELKIEIKTNENWVNGETYSGTIYLDNLRVSYPGHNNILRPSGIFTSSTPGKLSVFPNPAEEFITVNVELLNKVNAMTIKLFDLRGRLVKPPVVLETGTLHSNSVVYPVGDISKGIYILSIISAEETLSTKVIIE